MGEAYIPAPNHRDDDTGEDFYLPYTIDSSIVAILRHRGVPEQRIQAVVMDLDYSTGLASDELDELLPAARPSRAEGRHIVFEAVLSSDARWDGRRLTLRGRGIPETVLTGMVGRRLRDVVDHPALPDRPVVSARTHLFGVETYIEVEEDAVEVLRLSGAGEAVRRASEARCEARRRATGLPGAHEDEWTWEINRRRTRSLQELQEGIVPHFDPWCWGGEPITTRTGRRMKGWLHRLLPDGRRGGDVVPG